MVLRQFNIVFGVLVMKIVFILASLLLLFVFPQNINAKHQKISVTYISHVSQKQQFGQRVHSFAKASASDLGIDLNIVLPSKDLGRYEYLEFAKKVFAKRPKPDFIIAIFYRMMSKNILELSKKNDIPIFIVNTNISVDEINIIGNPREKYENFLGVFASNEQFAGYSLAKYLIKESKKQNPNKTIKIIGISGPKEAVEAVERNKGLLKAVSEEDNVVLHQLVYGNWNKETAYHQTARLLKRYTNNIDIIWTASDEMSIGAKKAIDESGDSDLILTGGVDWSKEGILAVKDELIDVTVGGHFMNGGFALVLLYDYFNGIDFKKELGSQIKLNMSLLSKKNVNKYLNKFTENDWNEIDFKKYSKHLNPKLKKYDFSIDTLFNNLE